MKQAGWPNLLAGSMGLCALHSCCGSPQCLRRSLAFRPASGVRNVRVGRPSVLDVVGEAPRAAGGRRVLRAGRRQLHESLYVALVRGDVRERELLARRDRCVCSASSEDPNAGFSYDVASRGHRFAARKCLALYCVLCLAVGYHSS